MKLAAAASSVASAAPATAPATPRVLLAGICNPYEPGVGTKVLPSAVREFQARMKRAVQEFDFGGARVPGQGFIPFNEGAHTLSAGIGRRSENPADFCLRQHRGRVEAFLRREWAPPCEGAALIIYTREAYLADPDVQADRAESARIRDSSATHVLVAVLGFAGPRAPLSPYRLVHNLAGGNNEALAWTADEIRTKAKESLDYDNEWAVVSD